MPAPATILNDHDGLVAAASIVAEVFGLGDDVTPSDQWPIDDGDSVLTATISGGVDGRIFLAVNDQVAERLSSDVGRLNAGLQRALDELAGRHEIDLVIADIGRADERPDRVVEITDEGQLCALFGLSLVEHGADTAPVADVDLSGPTDREVDAAPYEPQSFSTNGVATTVVSGGALDVLREVDMEVTVELGRTSMPIRELLALQPGMVIEIDRAAGAPIDVLVNGRMIACGEVVVIDEEFGIRITEIVGAPA